MSKAFYDEFEKRYGIKVVDTSPVDLGKLRAMVQSKNVEWTVTEIGGQDALLAEQSGLLEPLDLKIIDLSQLSEAHAEPQVRLPQRRLLDRDGLSHGRVQGRQRPKSWAEFWDVQEIPGPAHAAECAGRQPRVRAARRRRAPWTSSTRSTSTAPSRSSTRSRSTSPSGGRPARNRPRC